MRKIIMFIIAAVALWTAVQALPCKSYQIQPPRTPIAHTKVSPAFEAWLDELAKHENCPIDGMIDSNGQMSYGPFCYQALTFKRYGKEFGIPFEKLQDPEAQRELTIDIIERYPYGWMNWLNTCLYTAQIGLPPEQKA